MLFVALFSAIVSTPIALSIDWVIQNVLAAPIRPVEDNNVANNGIAAGNVDNRQQLSLANQKSLPLLHSRGSFGKELSMSSKLRESMAANAQLEKLMVAIKGHRNTLTKAQLDEFDGASCVVYIMLLLYYFFII